MARLGAGDDASRLTGFRKPHRCARKFRYAMYVGGCALLVTASVAHARTLYESDGIQVTGTTRKLMRSAATCKPQGKQRSGKRLDIWRVDFSAVNGSRQTLKSLTVNASIASA